MLLSLFVLLSDSKQNGDANVALSEEEGCSLTQPLSPSEKWSLRVTRGRDKSKKEGTCFLLTSGDPGVHTGGFIQYISGHVHMVLSVKTTDGIMSMIGTKSEYFQSYFDFLVTVRNNLDLVINCLDVFKNFQIT